MTVSEISSIVDQDFITKLPAPLQKGVGAFNAEFEQELFLFGALTVSSGLFNKVKGRYFQREVLPNLFFLCLAPPATGKGALIYAKKLVQKVHQLYLEQSTKELQRYMIELKEYSSSKRKDLSGEPPVRPPFKVVNIPANCTSAKMLQHLADNQYDNVPQIILETEADSLSGGSTSEWPILSEILRKSFHNESISYSRKTNNEYFEINNPSLAVALSGTPDQLFRLISSAENGLLSRFLIMQNHIPPVWLDVRPKETGRHLSEIFEALSQEFFDIWKFANTNPFEFLLHDDQWDRLNDYCESQMRDVLKSHDETAVSLVKRHGLMLYKIAMVLTVFRRYEWEDKAPKTYCLDEDFQTALTLSDRSLHDSLDVYNTLPKSLNSNRTKPKEEFIKSLPDSFTRNEAVEISKKFSLSARSVDGYLSNLVKTSRLTQPKTGFYKKNDT